MCAVPGTCARAWRNARANADGVGPVASWSGGAAISSVTMVCHRADSMPGIAPRIAASSQSIIVILPTGISSLRMCPVVSRGPGQSKNGAVSPCRLTFRPLPSHSRHSPRLGIARGQATSRLHTSRRGPMPITIASGSRSRIAHTMRQSPGGQGESQERLDSIGVPGRS